MDYEERFVAFIDIVGFKDLIKRSIGPIRSVTPAEIREALEVPQPIGSDKIILSQIGDISDSGHRMATFSDCIAITTIPTEKGLMHLLHHVSQIGFKLIRMKILCRGGITRGLIYHDDKAIFGPAMINAVEMEKNDAKYPRIILNSDIVQYGHQSTINKIFKRFVLEDDDGWYFVHTLRVLRMIMDCEMEPPYDICEMCSEIDKHIRMELDRLSGKEREKVLWFKKYFDWSKDRSAWDNLKKPFPTLFMKDLRAPFQAPEEDEERKKRELREGEEP